MAGSKMIVTTTNTVEGYTVTRYLGIVTGETILGANVFKDFMAGLSDIFGGRSKAYETTLNEARNAALQEMMDRASALGANAILGVDLDYETVGQGGSMLMVNASGTAVVLE